MDYTTILDDLRRFSDTDAIVKVHTVGAYAIGRIVCDYYSARQITRYFLVHNNPALAGYSIPNKYGFKYSYCLHSSEYGLSTQLTCSAISVFDATQLTEFADPDTGEIKYGIIRYIDTCNWLHIDTVESIIKVPLHCVTKFDMKTVDSTPIHVGSSIWTTSRTIMFEDSVAIRGNFHPGTEMIVEHIMPFNAQGLAKLYCRYGPCLHGITFGMVPSGISTERPANMGIRATAMDPTADEAKRRMAEYCSLDARYMHEYNRMPIISPLRTICDYLMYFGGTDPISPDEPERKDGEQEPKVVVSPTAVQKFINILRGYKPPNTKLDLPPREENTPSIGQELQLLTEQKLVL